MGSNQIGGGSVLIALNTCTKNIIGNWVTIGQDFHKIWCLQCTVLPDVIGGVYKKMPKSGKIVFCISSSFMSEPMTTERQIDDLVREFEQEGLIAYSNRPPASVPGEDAQPAPPRPMQTRSARKKCRTEVRSKLNQDRQRRTGKMPTTPPMDPPGSAQVPAGDRENIAPPWPPYL